MFDKFDKRLEQEVRRRVNERYEGMGIADNAPEVKVSQNMVQKYSVWFGGSVLASGPMGSRIFKSRQDYEEWGPQVARHNPVFTGGM